MKKTIKKRAFISAIAMLIVSAIVLTSSTFAWFSMAKRVNVETMNLNITSPEGVQISGNASAFTTTLNQDDLFGGDNASVRFKAYEGNRNHLPSVISPASTQFGTNYNNYPKFFSGSINDEKKLVTTLVTSETASDFGVVVFDLFVKVADAQQINFGSSTVACTANEGVPCAMRIGVVNCGVVSEGALSTEILAKKPAAANAANRIATMFQPDALNHTADAIANNGATQGEHIATRYLEVATNMNQEGTKSITTNTGYASPAIGIDTYNADDAYFNAAAGVNRIRVYLWMEGNDVDCSNEVAGSSIEFDFVLTIA